MPLLRQTFWFSEAQAPSARPLSTCVHPLGVCLGVFSASCTISVSLAGLIACGIDWRQRISIESAAVQTEFAFCKTGASDRIAV